MARCLLDLENQTETDFNLARIYIDCCSINSYSIAGSFLGTIKLGSLVKIRFARLPPPDPRISPLRPISMTRRTAWCRVPTRPVRSAHTPSTVSACGRHRADFEDNSHGYTDFHCQTPSVETGIEKPEVVKTDYVIDYTRLNIDQRVLMKSEQDGYDFFYTYGLDKLQVMTIGEGSNWWGQSIKKMRQYGLRPHRPPWQRGESLRSVRPCDRKVDYTDWGEVRRYTDITVDGGFRELLPEITYATHEYDDVLNQFYAKARMYDAEKQAV